ncbi:type I DNA topoisomerase, partial [Candidatus Peregrinibacteria bacterium]|nr:type I DNA topoisomerase [Candidatus Peregrinibacteria bacterium]
REGEAIAWHILEALGRKEDNSVKRIVFHEITESAIKHAINYPRNIDHNLVNAQQARRILDRLVGYELSPLLWKKVRYGLSAGRVQSVAVRLIVDREREINAFKQEEYWTIMATFEKKEFNGSSCFEAILVRKGENKVQIGNQAQAENILKELKDNLYEISLVEEKTVKRYPAPPFITSTLQQEAARKLRFSVRKSMMIAQQLYEGVDIGNKRMGLITYMRTDSVHLADSALKQAREVISAQFGNEYALSAPRHFKSKKGAQEAHEAIRPVDFEIFPSEIKPHLDKDQANLYELIWKRAIASQMAEAILDQTVVEVKADASGYIFRASGQVIKFPGFMRLYKEDLDNNESLRNGEAQTDEDEKILPKLSQGEALEEKGLSPQQHFTKPPPRYTEASLVRKLEAEGIGRPSTYAPTISTIISRGYIEKERQNLKPTDTAGVVNDLLVEHFSRIVDIGFTATMEEDLDKIAEGQKSWVPLVREFYDPFHEGVILKEKTLKKEDIVNEKSQEKCTECGSEMVVKLGRFGKFLSCSNYPKCKTARPLKENEVQKTPERIELEKKLGAKKCEKCGKPMEIKDGKYGEFLACTAYPDCKHVQAIIKFTGVKCPKCKNGQLIERRTRKGGKVFYGCNKFPKCRFATWDKPLKTTCKKCGGIKVEKLTKKEGKQVKEEVCLGCKVE